MTLQFKLHYLNNGITVTRDEIHIYMEPPDPLDRVIFKPFVLTFIDTHTNKTIRTYRVPAFNQGWQVLSLNKFTNKWVKNPSSNNGIRVIISRGGKRKYAYKNPFINFPEGNSPYMILFASESDQSLMAWRFLIQNALNSVAGNTQSRRGRDVSRRISRDLSQQFTIGQQSTHSNQKSQCKAVETDMNLTNFKVNGSLYILHPQIYKMVNCSSACIMRPATSYINSVQHKGKNQTHIQYCCVPTKYLNLMVLLKDPLTGDLEVQQLENFIPTGCMWSKQ